MGYASTTESISAERAEQLRAERRERSYGWASFESKLAAEAVSQWQSGDHDRNGSPSAYGAKMHPPVAAGVRERGIDWDTVSVDEAQIFPIAGAASVTTTTKKVKVTVPGALADKLRAERPWAAMEQLRALVGKGYKASELGDIEVLSIPAPRKPAAKATEGKAVTRYVIVGSEPIYTQDAGIRAAFATKYESQADARAAAVALLTAHDTLPALSVEAVVGRVTEDGTFTKALVAIARPVADEAAITVNVTTHTVKPGAKIERYEVTFFYHH